MKFRWTSTSPLRFYRGGAEEDRSQSEHPTSARSIPLSHLSATVAPTPATDSSSASSPTTAPLAEPLPVHSFGGLQYCNYGDQYRVVFVLGGPGAGKGTQSALLEEHYPVCHLSVGELLRNVPQDFPHRADIESSLVQGQIVPVEWSLALLKQAMADQVSHVGKETFFLVDGFPRNFDNLNGWCHLMADAAVLTSVLVYQCPLPILEARIVERSKESGRSDDNLDTVQRRFRTFEHETLPVIARLRELSLSSSSSSSAAATASSDSPQWTVADLSGDQPLEQVWLETQQVANRLILNDVLRANAALLQAVQNGDVTTYEQLCDPEWFTETDPLEVMQRQEGVRGGGAGEKDNDVSDDATFIANAQVDVLSGTHVAVSYDRVLQGQPLREKRFWSHQGSRGWRNVHFARIPSRETLPN